MTGEKTKTDNVTKKRGRPRKIKSPTEIETKEKKTIYKLLEKVILKPPIILIFQIVSLITTGIGYFYEYYRYLLLIQLILLIIPLLIFSFEKYIYPERANPNVKIRVRNFALCQIILFIITVSIYFWGNSHLTKDQYYKDLDFIIGDVIETKIATMAPLPSTTPENTATITPISTITVTPSLTPTPTLTFTPTPESFEAELLLREFNNSWVDLLKDNNRKDELDLDQYFCINSTNALQNFYYFTQIKFTEKYPVTGDSDGIEINCQLEENPKFYDYISCWYVEIKDTCEVIQNDTIQSEYDFEIKVKKPNDIDKDYCILTFVIGN